MTISPDEIRRLDSWTGVIAQSLRPEAPVARTADGLRIGRKGSLSITADATWYDHETGKGGHDALSLIRHLRGCSAEAAIFWARGWLEQHLGDGDLHVEVDAEAVAEASARRTAWALRVLDDATDPLGTPAEAYLRNRGLTPPYPPVVRRLEVARFAESAVVGRLTDVAGESVGVQLGYIDPQGRKSVMPPQRQLFLRDREAAKQGTFRIDVPGPAEGAPEFIITEGLENALALAQVGAGKTVLGVPGVGRLREIDLPASAAAVAFRDGKDVADSPAAKAFVKAVDRWLLAKVEVRVTDTPSGEDANSVLFARGAEELRRLVTEAQPGELSLEGESKRLSALDPTEYELARKEAAKKHGVRIGFLDAAVKAARAAAEGNTHAGDGVIGQDEPEPWPDPVDGEELLDELEKSFNRFLVLPSGGAVAMALWTVHTHCLDAADETPRLTFTSPEPDCGKTTSLKIEQLLALRTVPSVNISPAALYRTVERYHPTLLVDEADTLLADNEELRAVLNSGHSRSSAFVLRCEGDDHEPRRFGTWAAVAIAAKDGDSGKPSLPDTVLSRSIIIRMRRKLRTEKIERFQPRKHKRELDELHSRVKRWARDNLEKLGAADPDLPERLQNRDGDNWRPLFAIAELAGGRWPELAFAAAHAGLADDQTESLLVALLEGIRRAFGVRDRMSSTALIDFLIEDDAYDWATANRGRQISEAWLSKRLRGVIAPTADGRPGSEQWRAGQARERGYSRSRFVDSWKRYLPFSKDPEKTRDTGDTRDAQPKHRTENGNFGTGNEVSTCDDKKSTRDTAPLQGEDDGVTATEPACHGSEHTNQVQKNHNDVNGLCGHVTGGTGVTGSLRGEGKDIPSDTGDGADVDSDTEFPDLPHFLDRRKPPNGSWGKDESTPPTDGNGSADPESGEDRWTELL